MENHTEKGIIFTMLVKEYIKEIGKMEKKKALANQLLRISMDTLDYGETIKKMEKALIFIQMDKNIMEVGFETKKKVKGNIDIKMVMYTKGLGKMIEGMDLAQ